MNNVSFSTNSNIKDIIWTSKILVLVKIDYLWTNSDSCFILCSTLPAASLDMLEKIDSPLIPDGYGVSLAFYCLLDVVKSVQLLIEGESGETPAKDSEQKPVKQSEPSSGNAKTFWLVNCFFLILETFRLQES